MCDFVIGYCGADGVDMSNWKLEKPLIENWRCVLRYLLDCLLLTMSVLLLWNWSSQAGRLPLTETHLKQPMPAAGGFSVKKKKPTVITNFAGRVLNVHTGVSRFFVSKFLLLMFLGLDFGAKKRYLNGRSSVFQTESSWFCFTPELRSEEARAAPSRTLTITCGCNSLWWNLVSITFRCESWDLALRKTCRKAL